MVVQCLPRLAAHQIYIQFQFWCLFASFSDEFLATEFGINQFSQLHQLLLASTWTSSWQKVKGHTLAKGEWRSQKDQFEIALFSCGNLVFLLSELGSQGGQCVGTQANWRGWNGYASKSAAGHIRWGLVVLPVYLCWCWWEGPIGGPACVLNSNATWMVVRTKQEQHSNSICSALAMAFGQFDNKSSKCAVGMLISGSRMTI